MIGDPKCTLRGLALSHNSSGADGSRNLCILLEALSQNNSLERLDLSFSGMGSDAAEVTESARACSYHSVSRYSSFNVSAAEFWLSKFAVPMYLSAKKPI